MATAAPPSSPLVKPRDRPRRSQKELQPPRPIDSLVTPTEYTTESLEQTFPDAPEPVITPLTNDEPESEDQEELPATCPDCDGPMLKLIVDYNRLRSTQAEVAMCSNETCRLVSPVMRKVHSYFPMDQDNDEFSDTDLDSSDYDFNEALASASAAEQKVNDYLKQMEEDADKPIIGAVKNTDIELCKIFASDTGPAQLETVFPNGIPQFPAGVVFEQEEC